MENEHSPAPQHTRKTGAALKADTNAENPFKLLDLRITPPKTWAAGVPAVIAAMKDLVEEKTFSGETWLY
ncbi:hypothetical protein LWM68_09390 [Niabella sp. W65]|nr:hypothetical protein [Niabella sp. W65]MCH7362963.1 hypothetical protein [Niabella sp. W65]ULT38902.1 hypothetical protein KRR40_28055 [Niabella sp. I65]